EEDQEEDEVTDSRAPRTGAALAVSDFARSQISHSGRTKVRPLSFLGRDNFVERRAAIHA
ncbi:MAG: hypothetical protein WBE14_26065, partial [Xanthobacteraceae bacterium]